MARRQLRQRLDVLRDLIALAATPPGQTLYVLPTYTAMLEIRKTLSELGYTHPFWEE